MMMMMIPLEYFNDGREIRGVSESVLGAALFRVKPPSSVGVLPSLMVRTMDVKQH